MTTVKQGIVLSYDRGEAKGVVALDEEEKISLGSTYFHISRPIRHPRQGDKVDVVFSGGLDGKPKVVYVRLQRSGTSTN